MDSIHMAETTTPRLMAAAKEFNIGRETLVDFLVGKGFSKDDLKPTAKLTDDMYRSLQQEFQGDKVAKIKSNQIDLPKGSAEAKRKNLASSSLDYVVTWEGDQLTARGDGFAKVRYAGTERHYRPGYSIRFASLGAARCFDALRA